MNQNDDREKYLTEIRQYYKDIYVKCLNLDMLKSKKLREFLKQANLAQWSHRNRLVRNIQIMKHSYVYNKTDNITICFKATLDGTSCIYAYVHCRCKSNNNNAELFPEFVCAAPTFKSQDGEYRNRMIPWEQFNALFVKYAEYCALIEKSVLSRFESGRLSFQSDFFYPIKCTYNKTKLENFVNSERLPIKLYIICWMCDFHFIHSKTMENHINPAYQYMIYQEDDMPIYQEILDKIGKKGFIDMSYFSSHYYSDVLTAGRLSLNEIRVGQKIFPLSAIEAVKTNDINFNVWREIYINNMASNLVLNLITPCFPFINNWFYIQHAHAGIFDNLAMHTKYSHSDVAAEISAQLKTIDKHNYVEENRSRGPISGKFLRLSKLIHKSIIYADSDIKLTDLAVCMTNEYVGRTLRDMPSLMTSDEFKISYSIAFTNAECFAKHMFEFVYSFYCMNTSIGIFHGDLHMNNATIYGLYVMHDKDGNPKLNDPKIVYIVGDEGYMFQHSGSFSMIIDFSRAIIGDYDRLEHEFSPLFAELYFKEQRIRFLQIIYHHFPKLVERFQTQIESLLLNDFFLMFKIFTALDTYVIMNNILNMFSIDDAFTRGKIKLAEGVRQLLNDLISNAEKLIEDNLKAAISGKIKSTDDIEWPNHTIIKNNFAKFHLSDSMLSKPANIVEIFNSNNEVVHDIEDYDTWGPLLSLEKEIELRKVHNQELHQGIKRWLEYKQRDESEIVDQLTSKYAQQERDTLEFESWMLM